MSLCVFPRYNSTGNFTTPNFSGRSPNPLLSQSLNDLGSSAPRYQILKSNTNYRRQRGGESKIPIFRDENTPIPRHDDATGALNSDNQPVPIEEKGYIRLDLSECGAGSCSIQTTFQASNETEARWLHDQLIPLGPVMLALTAAAPIWKGYLVDVDSRWQRYSDCSDDRTVEEMSQLVSLPFSIRLAAHLPNRSCLQSPRWTCNRVYLSREKPNHLEDPDLHQPMNESVKQNLMSGGMDESLAKHFTQSLSRDPLVLSREEFDEYDPTGTNFFELLYGSSWPSVRFKPPESADGPGWRVEFRPMETQITDEANAAFCIFMYLLSRAISTFHLSFYIPIEQLVDSMDRAQNRDAVRTEKIFFRRLGWSSARYEQVVQELHQADGHCEPEVPVDASRRDSGFEEPYAAMSVDEIINGEDLTVPNRFPGLADMVWTYMRYLKMSTADQVRLSPYIERVEKTASGEIPTAASWMRSFVTGHRDYQKDSYVSEKICYDLMIEMIRLNG
jgi:glutamate--cysteine ligase catalytic subunit